MTTNKKIEKKSESTPHEVSAAEAVRDVFIAAMNTGNFALLLVFSFLMFYLYKLPDKELATLTRVTMKHLLDLEGLAYIILIIGGLFVRAYIRSIKSQFDKEVEKYKTLLEQEKNKPQTLPPTPQPTRRQA